MEDKITHKSVIFIDIDGVLNSKPYCDKMSSKHISSKENPLIKDIDPAIIRRIVNLAKETDSDIVMSSTWKSIWNCDENAAELFHIRINMKKIFEENGMIIADTTPDISGHRAEEIKAWLDSHPEVEHFVSLDDDYGDVEYQKYGLDGYNIHTLYWCLNEEEGGFQENHYQKALQILKKPWSIEKCEHDREEKKLWIKLQKSEMAIKDNENWMSLEELKTLV